jgi:hypothetical protein
MAARWHTLWQGQDIVVFRDDAEVHRIAADAIERVVLVQRDGGELPTDLVFTVVLVGDDALLFPAETGFAGRVNFERQAFWTQRACVYWAPYPRATLPSSVLRARWWQQLRGLTLSPGFVRAPRTDLIAAIDSWPLSGPQTWEQRKWQHIGRRQLFSTADTA